MSESMNYNTELERFLRTTRDPHTGAERDDVVRRLMLAAFNAGFDAGRRIAEQHAVERFRKAMFDSFG